MKLSVDILILGAGYSGLIIHKALRDISAQSIIIERGYSHGYTGDDYIIFTKDKFNFSADPISVKVSKLSSGNVPFDVEYTKKLYNSRKTISIFSDEDSFEEMNGYPVSSNYLLQDAKIYGNIEALRIDTKKRILYGKILHLNKQVEIKYNTLINTIPIHRFSKLVNVNLLDQFGLFISYFPIGIKRATLEEQMDGMTIEYFSDPNIPFYRKQKYGKTIYYEYCLNKPFNERFDSVIVPGKFVKVSPIPLGFMWDYFSKMGIWHIGRFSIWDPDFLLDHIINIDESKEFSKYITNLHKKVGLKHHD